VDYYTLRSGSLLGKTSAQWIDLFEQRDIPCMRYNSLENLVEDPHLQQVGFLRETVHPSEGPILEMGLTNHYSGGVRQQFTPAPRLGEHTLTVLAEHGYGPEEIELALQNQVIFSEAKGV
jgi:crotonobetainyl-CoA:carnitine CoA-transferase CaiB-like acyl-CoA transferase